MNIIFANGPPGCGKDEVAKIMGENERTMVTNYEFMEEKFAMPLRLAAMAFFGIHEDDFEHRKREDPKVRQFMIGISEDVAKRRFGKSYFAHACADRVFEQGPDNVLITDAGFGYEVMAFMERLDTLLGESCNYELWQITRPGHTFEMVGDSRQWVYLPEEYGRNLQVQNDRGLEEFSMRVLGLVRGSVWEEL